MSRKFFALAISALLLSACAVGPDFKPPETAQPQWHSALAHGGKIENLSRWWEQLNDAVLNDLIASSEKNNPSIDMALAKMNEARANANASGAAFYPTLSANAGATRSRMAFGQQVILQTVDKLGFDASWELDLFGKNRRTAEAAQARFGASDVAWHDARISLAAEVAEVYVELRQCEMSTTIAAQQRDSLAAVQEMMQLKTAAGISSNSDAWRAQANAADARSAYVAKQGECARDLNRLVALSGFSSEDLQKKLAAQQGKIPVPNAVEVSSVAANALRQRPDVAIAEMNLAAASADIGATKATLYPSLTLLGSVARSKVFIGTQNAIVPTWSFGPSLTLPLFSGGRATATVDAAQARYDYALANYQQTVRLAVRDVEDSLLRLNVANERAQQAQISRENQAQLFNASEARNAAGLANRLTLEDARRLSLQAQDTAAAMDKETVSAWIALYKALGGGWERDAKNDTLAQVGNTHQEISHEQK